ncbi:PEP-CTERM sorting domain-containing protein [Oxalobacteraceae bacterium OTU3CINTB1]|nr:PEP-CTERM sorting domain-containing protein [Oxalobacteraceae bacterium OTU3CINTB1]
MKFKTVSTAATLVLLMSGGAAMAAAGGNGKGNNGNGKGNGGSTTPVVTKPATDKPATTPVITLPPSSTSCAGASISVAGASCIGFVSGNLNGNKPSLTEINSNLGVWGVHLTEAVASTSMLSGLTGNTINFAQQLYGDTIVSIHYGNVTDVLGHKQNNVTAFYRFDAGQGAGVDSFTTAFNSLSNATLYSTGKAPVLAVPEAETYAMMLAGLGLMGVVARRRKQK